MSFDVTGSPVFFTLVNYGKDPDLRFKVLEEARLDMGIQNHGDAISCHLSECALKTLQMDGCQVSIRRKIVARN